MPTTPILGITQVSTSQNGKETTINDAILALEEATNAKLVASLASGNVTLTAFEATRHFIFEVTDAVAASELLFPMTVNTNPYNRVIVVRNESGHGLTVRFTASGLTTVSIPNGESRLISADADTGMDVAAEPPSVISFLSLTDTPSTFASQAGRFLAVNVAENALEFVTGATFPALAGNEGKYLTVNGTATGVEWTAPDFPDTFLELTDTPASYTGQANKIVRVNSTGTGLEFGDLDDIEVVTYASAQRWRIVPLEPGVWPENPPGSEPGDPEYIEATDQVGFGEIEFLDQDGNDITGTGTASASNSLSGFEPSRAFNNDTSAGDGWLTEDGFVGEVWIEYDFGVSVEPRQVRLYSIDTFPQYGPMRFLIQYWDGTTWVTAGDRPAALWALEPVQTFSINGIPLEILPEAPLNGSLYGRYNGSWLKINAEVATVTTTSYNLEATEVFQYRRFTNAGTKTLNIRTEATHPMPIDGEWYIHNATGAALNVVPASGVTVNAPAGGSLIVPARGTLRIKRIATDTYDLFGNTVSTESAGEIPPLVGNANKLLAVRADETAMEWINPPVTYTDEQARDAVGAALVAGTNVTIAVNDVANTITISASSIGLNEEQVRDTIAAALRAGTNITITNNDAGDTITIATSALDAEGVRDTIGAALVAGSNITIAVNDAANTITVAAEMDQEVIRDTIASALVAGTNVLITVDDVANTITIDSVGGGGGGGLDAEAVRDVIGAALVAGANTTITVNDDADTITIASSTDPEVVRDTIATALVAGTNITIVPNDGADTITLNATMDQEVIRDTIAAALVAGTNVTITHNDVANTITIDASAASTDPEVVRDTIATALVAGANVTITVNDLGDTITIAAAGTDAEVVRDTIGTALVAGTNVTINVNDAANTITINAAGTDAEIVRDTIASALVAGAGISITVNDAADTITINNTVDGEVIRDTIATALIGGPNVTVTHDDVGDTITVSVATDGEAVRDTIAAALVAGAGVTITHNDAADTITIASDGASNLDELTDVDVTTIAPLGGQALIFDDVSGLWKPGTVSGGGGGGTEFLPLTTVTATTYDLPSSTAGRYIRFTADTAKTVNVRPEADHALPSDSEWHLRNVGDEPLTIVPGVGVVINAPAGGSLVVPVDGVVTLKRIAADLFDLLGSTISSNGVPYSIPFGFVAKPLGSETLLIHVFAEDVTFLGNFASSRAAILTNPAATATLSIRKNGIAVGGISVTTAGVVAFSTSGGTAVSFVAGDILTVVAQDLADATWANSAFTLFGSRT